MCRGLEGEDLPSDSYAGLKLFVQANVMRMNWSNAAESCLWEGSGSEGQGGDIDTQARIPPLLVR